MSTDLPFKKEEGWDYILTDDDRKKFAPKLATDEYWHDNIKSWVPLLDVIGPFLTLEYYRRRKSSGWVSVKEWLPKANQPIITTDGESLFAFLQGYNNPEYLSTSISTHWMPWELPALPQPPRPAAEVAFEKQFPVAPSHGLTIWLAAIKWAASNKHLL